MYLFTDLHPGAYIVQIAPENFDGGAQLSALRATARAGVDPDNDVNGDNNGAGATQDGIFSQAVTLIGGEEPVDDGDQDANTNLTVDFGFHGFDVSVDKSVDRSAASPLRAACRKSSRVPASMSPSARWRSRWAAVTPTSPGRSCPTGAKCIRRVDSCYP